MSETPVTATPVGVAPAAVAEEGEGETQEIKALKGQHEELVASFQRYQSALKELQSTRASLQSEIKAFKGGLGALPSADQAHPCVEACRSDMTSMQYFLPRAGSRLFRLIFGSMNVRFVQLSERIAYKQEFERYKARFGLVLLVLLPLSLLLANPHLDQAFGIMSVMYYSIIVLRESVLKVNGSRINLWWTAHHILTVAISQTSGVAMRNPAFRSRFRVLTLSLGMLVFGFQQVQTKYQLRRLRLMTALAKTEVMSVTSHETVSFRPDLMARFLLLPILFINVYQMWVGYSMAAYGLTSPWDRDTLCMVASGAGFSIMAIGNLLKSGRAVRRQTSKHQSMVRGKSLARLFDSAKQQ
ncbi:TMPIT-like protein [Kipferlia bialata]|uniref:TMPIT-like protein n=1 Tax=Kipferlia bialata TaxID=797122 RepID=A0A9K3GHT1_9EUKA|nr:TMPIT-like protein [Kipferlia bialata]|eukprot:g4940.t1